MVVHDGQVAVEVRHGKRGWSRWTTSWPGTWAWTWPAWIASISTATCPRCRCPGRSCSSCSTADSRSRLQRWWRRWAHTKQRGPDSLRSAEPCYAWTTTSSTCLPRRGRRSMICRPKPV